ncbi:MAG: alcohol dehydrogenase catalytic domain-containing protein [Chloroflexi bacterium]|nr:alcohol dehydrogenase catalytic domain-containing protein [Chloroflexota bacterium]MCI0578201.1 alcohol dehydrogenase catalytic domain-containing protein [Chloroflexota bacterium]MCI0645306.1 alcohol dehydrogenase catalytic domain-containing protein [Chloroflexota bacterium]MCI0729540.1 alcohol dehydrogenase catalytic domain-containing protein [Chloroflexota bacterium]
MKAVVISKPHQAAYSEQPRPQVDEGQVLVRVAAVGICMSDVEILEGTRPAPYVRYPVIPGHEWCGTIVEVGPGVVGLQAGERVAVEGHNFCGACFWCQRGQTNLCASYNEFGFTLPGGYAEYVAVRADLAHSFPDSLPFEVAALCEPAACAGHGLQRASVQPGDTVVVVGPGTVGLLGLAWARLFKAQRLVAVGLDRNNEALARTMGATDYLTVGEDPLSFVRDATEGRGADVVFEAAGSQAAVPLALGLARRGGTVVLAGISGGGQKVALESDLFCLNDLRLQGIFAYPSAVFVETLDRIAAGLLDVRPLISHTFPLEEYASAFELLCSRREPVGKILLKP